jgi:hypothetical protein
MPNEKKTQDSTPDTPPPHTKALYLFSDDMGIGDNNFGKQVADDLDLDFINLSKRFDQTNGSMIKGKQNLSGQYPNISLGKGDIVIYMLGEMDMMWSGSQDTNGQAVGYLEIFLKALVDRGAEIYIATVPKQNSYNKSDEHLRMGSDAAAQFWSVSVIKQVVTKVNSSHIHVVDVYRKFNPLAQYFDGLGLSKSGSEEMAGYFLEEIK